MRRSLPLLLCLLPAWAVAQGDAGVIARVVEEGKGRSQAMALMKELCLDIGPRLTSSTAMDRGMDWAVAKFKSWGLQNVRLEKWGEFPVGFDRGARQSGRMIHPEERVFEFTTPSWTPGTNGPLRAPAVIVPQTLAECRAMYTQLQGKWVVWPADRRAPKTRDEAQTITKWVYQAGALGIVRSSGDDLVHTYGNFSGLNFDKLPTEVQIIVRKSDADAVMKPLLRGEPVELEFDIENKWVKGPRSNYNVVAEIPGTEKPDEVVIVSGHFDSWDGPGSQGACDNGTGSISAMEAARILMAVGAKPKRTIRFILWTGEEQGLLGSVEYVRQRQAELSKISAVLVDDGGTNYHGGYAGPESMRPMMEAAFAPTVAAFPTLPMKYVVTAGLMAGGSDHTPFIQMGVPAFYTLETGRANYPYVHHTQHDKIDQVIPEYLVQSSVNHAIVSYNLACAATLLPRE